MSVKRIGFVTGALGLTLTLALPPPAGMPQPAWVVGGLVLLMAAWWMTEAIPLTATALMPFVVLPLTGVLPAEETASAYYSPILFLILGGAFLALAIERAGLHRRLALHLLSLLGGRGGPGGVLLAFMGATAALSMLISNTSAALILMPVAVAVLAGGGIASNERDGLAGALPMGIAFAASIGGLGTLVGSPTNAIAVGLLDTVIGLRISFAQWSLYGLPLVIAGVPLAALIIARVQRIGEAAFDFAAAQATIGERHPWTTAERRLLPVIAVAFAAWMTVPLIQPLLPAGGWTDGTIAVIAGLALFIIPDGTGRPLLVWEEADRAPWAVIMMFGGGLALAAGVGASGLAAWLGEALLFLRGVPLPLIALVLVALVVLVTEFASNVATASAIIPVIAALSVALGADPALLALPAAMAASWGFMLPAGTGPNAIAWATGRIVLGRMVRAGALLDVAGVFLIVGTVWIIRAVTG